MESEMLNPSKEALNPSKLLQLSGSYWQTCTLHCSVKLDIFTIIDNDKLSADQIALKLNAPSRSTAMLLDALCAMELLKKELLEDNNIFTYSNTQISSLFLSKQSPKYAGFMIMHHHHLLESWSRLSESILSGKPVRTRAYFSDEEKRESFLMGMFNIAMSTAPGLVPTIDLSGKKQLLDLGGGPGTYAVQFCLNNPDLKAVVFDLETTKPFAEKTIKRFNLQDRITFQAGDFLNDPIKGKYDVVWLSHILHGEPLLDCGNIIKKAASVLESGGTAVIHEFIMNNKKDSPLFPALFSLNMLLGTEGGQAYSEQELMDMLKKAGFSKIMRTPYIGPMESGLIIGQLC